VVSYRNVNYPGARGVSREVLDWRQSELVVENQTTFAKFEISVRAKNDIGLAPECSFEKKQGYSVENSKNSVKMSASAHAPGFYAAPLVSPANFAVDEDSINSTSARFTWDPVEDEPELIRGFLKGNEVEPKFDLTASPFTLCLQIHFWRESEPDDVRKHAVIINEWNPCPTIGIHSGRRRRKAELSAYTNELWPYSQIVAGILVINGGKSGELSDTISFSTPEGLPSVVTNFRVTEQGSHHLKLEWEPPLFANGILRGYVIGYRTGKQTQISLYRNMQSIYYFFQRKLLMIHKVACCLKTSAIHSSFTRKSTT
jgi:hypothetical protein